jgi:hypothetical protein
MSFVPRVMYTVYRANQLRSSSENELSLIQQRHEVATFSVSSIHFRFQNELTAENERLEKLQNEFLEVLFYDYYFFQSFIIF